MNPNPFDQPVDPNAYGGPPVDDPYAPPGANLPVPYVAPGYPAPPAPGYPAPPAPYGQSTPYGQPGPYGQPAAYGQPVPYGQAPTYGQPLGYPPPPSFGPYAPPSPYSQYPQPGGAFPGRPGVVVAAAVLSYVTAGLLILSGFLLLIGASAVNDINDAYGTSSGTTKFLLSGVADLVSAGFLIAGGVMIAGRQPRGRVMVAVGSLVCLGAGVFWLTVTLGSIFWVLLYCTPVILATIFVYGVSTARWLGLAPLPQYPPVYGPPAGPGPYGY